MKTPMMALLGAAAVLCAANTAMAYTPKSEDQMKKECEVKWKATPAKIEPCLRGKKAYQARMQKKGMNMSTKAADKSADKTMEKAAATH